MPDIRKSMDGWGVEPFELGVDEFSARYRADIAAFRKVVREADIRVE